MEKYNELFNLYYKDVKKYIFEGLKIKARVYKVYDGDSINIIFKYKDGYIRQPCRINGIDTPEISRCTDEEKQLGLTAKEYLSSLILEKLVEVEILKTDKFGRQLVNVSILDENQIPQTDIAELLITGGYAKPYYGGTKGTWV